MTDDLIRMLISIINEKKCEIKARRSQVNGWSPNRVDAIDGMIHLAQRKRNIYT